MQIDGSCINTASNIVSRNHHSFVPKQNIVHSLNSATKPLDCVHAKLGWNHKMTSASSSLLVACMADYENACNGICNPAKFHYVIIYNHCVGFI